MDNNKKPSEPVEEFHCKEEAEEAERWARIERAERNADIMSYLSLAFSIIALLITLAKRLPLQ